MLKKNLVESVSVSEGTKASFVCRYYLTEREFVDEENRKAIVYGISVEKLEQGDERILEESTYIGFSNSRETTIDVLNKIIAGSVTPCVLIEVLDELVS